MIKRIEYKEEDFEKFILDNKTYQGVRVAFDEIGKQISEYKALKGKDVEVLTVEGEILAVESAIAVLEDVRNSIFTEMIHRVELGKRFAESLSK